MKPIDPVRGPLTIPRTGKLPQNLMPKPYEVVVLRSHSGKMIQLRRGEPPTFGHRFVGGFTEAYYVDSGEHTRTFTSNLSTKDVGIDLVGEVDVELTVNDDCCEVVRERRGDLAEQLANWCQGVVSSVTAQYSAADEEHLASVSKKVTDRLRTESSRLRLYGMSIRELRVRLRFANEEVVRPHGAATLTSMLQARTLERLQKMYEPIFGPDFTRLYITLVQKHEDQIPAFLERLQNEQQLAAQNKWQLLGNLLNDQAIEPHFREQFARGLGKMLLDTPSSTQDLAAKLLSGAAEFQPLESADEVEGDDQHVTGS